MEKPGILTRITYILSATFICTTIFAGLQNVLGNTGVFLALIINIFTAIKLKKHPQGTWQHIVGLSIIWYIIMVSLIILIGFSSFLYLAKQVV